MANSSRDYERKYASLISLIRAAKERGIECLLINSPHQLGETRDEMVQSLWRISEADLSIRFLESREDHPLDAD